MPEITHDITVVCVLCVCMNVCMYVCMYIDITVKWGFYTYFTWEQVPALLFGLPVDGRVGKNSSIMCATRPTHIHIREAGTTKIILLVNYHAANITFNLITKVGGCLQLVKVVVEMVD